MTIFSSHCSSTIAWFKNECRCFDLTIRSASVRDQEYILIFVGGVTGSMAIQPILESLSAQRLSQEMILYPATVTEAASLEEALLAVLQGQTLVLQEGKAVGWLVDTRSIPGRSPSEPTVEKSIRGSRDGFVEHLMTNIGLIRKRIKDPQMRIESRQFGSRTHTDLAIFYIADLVDVRAKDDLFRRMDQLDPQTDLHSERHLCELLYGQSFNPYPHVRYTERPDIVTIHLLQGNVAILVDQSPTAVLVPATFFETTSQIEEYTQTYLISVVLRFLRTFGVLCSLYLLPLWMMAVLNHHSFFLMPQTSVTNSFLFGLQVLVADGLVEWIRLSLIHSPLLLSSLLGMVAVFVLGDSAIAYGAYTQEILIVVAVVNIGNFVTSSYELSMANKISRLFLVFCGMLFGNLGIIVGIGVHLWILATSKSGGKPYLYPVFPLDLKELRRLFFGDFTQSGRKKNN